VGVARGLKIRVLVGGGWIAGGLAGPPRSRGVYSVVNDGPGGGARTRDVEYGVYIQESEARKGVQTFLGSGIRIAWGRSVWSEER